MSNPTGVASRSSRFDWLGGLFAAGMWVMFLIGWTLDIQSLGWFLWTVAIDLGLILMFGVWWFTRRSFSIGQRLLIVGCAILLGIVVGFLCRRTIPMPPVLAMSGVPIVLAVWWLVFMFTPRVESQPRAVALVVCLALAWSPFLLLRMDGFQGNLRADLHWRWTPTPEELFLAERAAPGAATQPSIQAIALQPGDWPAFRGPRRDGIARNLRIDLDWAKSPPKTLWKERVGPAWSSMIIVDGLLYTQEQRGDREDVVCRQASNGREVWVHEDAVRFEEPMSGIGPRATPAFDSGRIYAQGTRGALNCLDAATGRVIWSRDVHKETDAKTPMWGFCSSPLVLDGRVIVFTSGEGKKGLAAYSTDDGHPLWTCDTGKMSYASPQVLDGPGGSAILMFANEGLFCVDAPTGHVLWTYALGQRVGLPAALQVCQIGSDSIVLGNGAAFGTQRLQLASDQSTPAQKWVSIRMKPGFSDMVYHGGFLYGFDGTVFCCVDAATGTRRWREGHFGAGQVVLLEDQGVLIVSSEDGQAVLLRCNPEKYEELGRLQAISGKAWNHPAIANGCLFVRSDAEMACLQLAPSAANVP